MHCIGVLSWHEPLPTGCVPPPCSAHPLCSAHQPNSIYVTASHGADGKEEGEGGQPVSPSGRSNSMTRQLNVPWTLPGLQGLPVSQRMLSVLQGGGGGAEGQQAGEPADAGLSEDEALQLALALSIQDAQQQAAQAAGSSGEDAAETAADGGAQQAAAPAAAEQQQQGGPAEQPLPLHVRYNAAFASSGAEGRRNPLFGGSSATGDVPFNA